MVYYTSKVYHGLEKGRVKTIRIIGFTAAAVFALAGAAFLVVSDKYLYVSAAFVLAALLVFSLTAGVTSHFIRTGGDRRVLDAAITVTEADIHGMTEGVLYKIPLGEVENIYVEGRHSLIIKSRFNVYEIDKIKDPDKALEAFDKARAQMK